jgi:hypothetical protein
MHKSKVVYEKGRESRIGFLYIYCCIGKVCHTFVLQIHSMTGNVNHKGILGKYWKVLEDFRTFHMMPECSSKEDTRRHQKVTEGDKTF